MDKKKQHSFPLSTKFKLHVMRHSTEFASKIIQTDKDSPDIHSIYNIPYHKTHGLQQMDWHTPTKSLNKKQNTLMPTIFYIHGGAWASADKRYYTRFCKDMAERGFTVININYRLLPEFTLNDAYQDCISAIRYCIKYNQDFAINTDKIILAGDSAGAHLSALIVAKATSNILKFDCKFVGTILLYGLYNLQHMAHSKFSILPPLHQGFKQDKGKNISRFYHHFSPVSFITPAFPPTFLSCGKCDTLSPETIEFNEILRQHNIVTYPLIFPRERRDARHAFINLNNSARHEAIMAISKALKKFIKD